MDGQSELVGRLADWAKGAGVTPKWTRGALRLESAYGTAKAVITFPAGFWDAYPQASEARRNGAMDAIVSDVLAQYDPNWTQFEAKNIEVHPALLKEL